MTDILSLEQLVHLSLGDPEAGAVNFNVLKTLLLQMLKAMNLYNYKPPLSDDDQRTLKEALSTSNQQHVQIATDNDDRTLNENEDDRRRRVEQKKRDRSSDRLNTLEEKVFRFESQINALNHIPSNSEIIDRAKQIPKKTNDSDQQTKTVGRQGPILEVWQYTQLEKRIESAENGITRLASLLQDLLSEMNDLKESNETMKQRTDELQKEQDELKNILDQLNKEKNDWAKKSDVDNLDEKIRNLQNILAALREHFNNLPQDDNSTFTLPDLSGFVTWDRLEDALKGIRESIEKSAQDAAAALASARDARQPIQVIERQSQTSAKRKESPIITSVNPFPSDSLAEILEQLGTLNSRHEQLRGLVDALDKKKLNREEFDAFRKQQNDLFDRLAALERSLDAVRSQRTTNIPPPPSEPTTTIREIIKEVPTQAGIDHSGDITDLRTALQRMREELDRLKEIIQDLMNKENLSAQDIDALKQLYQQLDQTKADKTYVNNELDKKADKRDLDARVLKKDFHAACGELSQNINDCLQKFNLHEDIQRQDLDKINHDINEKLDRAELDALRDYMEKQMKKLKRLAKEQQQNQQHVHVMSEDEAAGLRRPLLRFHCISCDRPIDVQPHPQPPSLPTNPAMRPIQSPRPYTTYELDQIRQFQKSQQFNSDMSGGTTDVYATVRQCGGSHTVTLPFKRQVKTQPATSDESLLVRSEVDIKGQDGVIYKGRLDTDKLPAVDLHKKSSVGLHGPPPVQRSRLDSHLFPLHHQQQQHDSSELKRVLIVEQDLLNESQAFSLPKKAEDFPIESIFDWNHISFDELLEINQINCKDFYEQWKKLICKEKPCHHQKEIKKQVSTSPPSTDATRMEESRSLSCDCQSEPNFDMILHRQPMDEIELNEETCSQLNMNLSTEPSLNIQQIEKHSDQLNDSSPTIESVPENTTHSQISLSKIDKSTSTDFLPPTVTEQPDIFSDFFTNLFVFENTRSRTNDHHLENDEHWLVNPLTCYPHPFHNYPHQSCNQL